MTIMGHLGADPEVRFTSSGQKVTTLRVASNQRRGGQDHTFWWRVTIWGEHLDKILSYFKKGSAIVLMGEMRKPEIYTDKNGQPQISLDFVAHNISFPPFGKGDQQQTTSTYGSSVSEQQATPAYSSAPEQQPPIQQGQGEQPASSSAFSEDEIPF